MGSRGGSTRRPVEPERRDVLVHRGPGQVLREQVGRVPGAKDLEDPKVSPANPLLYPELAHCQVPHLADAGALYYSQCGTRVGVELEEARDPQVQEQRPQAKCLRGALHDTG